MTSYAFGPFILDDTMRTLYRDGLPVTLTVKVYDLIACLVRAQGKVVSKTSLVDQVWQHSSINDTTIAQHVYLARKALADLRGPHQFIRTVHSIGYRIAAEVTAVNDSFAFPQQSSGQFIALELLSGAYYFRRAGTPAALASCVELCEKAEAFDAALAQAPAAAAMTRIFQALYGYEPAQDAYAAARALAHRALKIDTGAPLAHTALAAVHLFADRDAQRALEHLSRAANQRAGIREVCILQVSSLIAQGRMEAAKHAAQEAARWMPESSIIPIYHAFALYHANELEAAASKLNLLLQLHPNIAFACLLLGFVELSRENYVRARDLFEKILDFDSAQPAAYAKYHAFAQAGLAHVHARTLGIDSHKDLTKLSTPVPMHYARAIALAGMSDWAAAAAEIRSSIAAAEPWAVFARTDPVFRSLPEAA
ncbi:MAG TPA: winged helix-turn-helix domain-containing protein [Candidatus Baltobacteraceae bacterium]|jgi:DNA-binding winged helix-turn-helix (wHTH) protein|nr:winged helix-turn-helix domain-containing protein [Candidatus Baltobacteraceae bacterium]